MSRLRRLDRKIIDQHLNDDSPIDTVDQSFIISHLTLANRESYDRNRLYFTVLLLVQIPVLIYVNHLMKARNASSLTLVVVLLSTTLTLIKLRSDTMVEIHTVTKYLNYVNGLVCLPLVVSFLKETTIEKLYYLLPVVNLGNLVIFRWWFTTTNSELEGLRGMTYKFKTV